MILNMIHIKRLYDLKSIYFNSIFIFSYINEYARGITTKKVTNINRINFMWDFIVVKKSEYLII